MSIPIAKSTNKYRDIMNTYQRLYPAFLTVYVPAEYGGDWACVGTAAGRTFYSFFSVNRVTILLFKSAT